MLSHSNIHHFTFQVFQTTSITNPCTANQNAKGPIQQIIFGYVGYNNYYTLRWKSINTIKDGFAECPIDAHIADLKQLEGTMKLTHKLSTLIPPVPNTCDLNIKYVNAILFDRLSLEL